ncbi:superoxide dismutase [Bacteroidota bacterium]|nr:superoxide dismutase [Bacteroidota bacterium]
MENTRRDFIKTSVLAAGALTFGLPGNANVPSEYPYVLSDLPYAFNALEPYIDAMTMEIHHDKHHKAYTDKFNAALEKFPDYQTKGIQNLFAQITQLPVELQTAVRNQGGGYWNHNFFWKMLSPEKTLPSEGLTTAINTAFGDMDKLKAAMTKAGLSVFGSGWVWLIENAQKELKIVTTSNQNNPVMGDATDKGAPILGIDVWEHAYYLKYQNKRADYLDGIWNVINWKHASQLYF